MAKEPTPKEDKPKTPKATEGVVLMAFGKRGYYFAAFNMAMSIKHFNPKLKITLLHDGVYIKELMHLGYFDKVITLKETDLKDKNGSLSPALAKLSVYNYLPYTHNLYLDVDGIALHDVGTILEHCKAMDKPYLTEVRGRGKRGDVINYDIWAKHDDTYPFFDLEDSAEWCAIQSSFAYIKKCDEAKQIFTTAKKYYKKGFPLKRLSMQWGGTIPDELMFSGACANLGYDPDAKLYPIFFGWKHMEISFTQMAERYAVLSLYGNGTGRTLTKTHYIEHYDRLMRKYAREMHVPPIYKSIYIMRDKHAG